MSCSNPKMNSPNIVKRGYLFDKKIGIIPVAVERKRWYILRQDLTQGFCVLEYYKDEKTAGKGDAPKGFINVYDVVAVQRVPDKKQMFEILCPGVAYRLMANSDLEADEWTAALSKLILYRKEDVKTLSLRRIPSSPTHMETIPERHRTLSDSSMQTHHSPSRIHPKSLTIPTPSHRHAPADTTLHFSHSPHMSHSLPTPPELAASPPMLPPYPPIMQRQRSNEIPVSLPSPSTSSDSSSMCSGSNASFETQAAFELERSDTRTMYRVHVKEADNLCVAGPADLVVSEDGISLHSIQTGQELVSWPISCLRRYGCNNVSFTILTGRFCSTGEGRFQFYTPHCRLVNTRVHNIAMAKAVGCSKSIPRRASEPAQMSEMAHSPHQSHFLHPHSSLPPRALSTSPPTYPASSHPHNMAPHLHATAPGYSRLQHPTVPPMTQEQYGKKHYQHPVANEEEYSKLQHFSNSMISLQSCTQSAIGVPIPNHSQTRITNSTTIGKPPHDGINYTQLAFNEPESPTESSVGGSLEQNNSQVCQSNV